MNAHQRLASRAVFAGSLLAFLIVGITWVGDFSAQWWILFLPFALLVGPLGAVLKQDGPGQRSG